MLPPHVSDDYTIKVRYYDLVVRQLGLDPDRDCFATPSNTRCAFYYTADQDALAQAWDPSEVMWLNPPWELWPQTADKLLASGCSALCLLPAWSKPWVKSLVASATKCLNFEAGTPLFERYGRSADRTLWGTWALRIEPRARTPAHDDLLLQNCTFMPRWTPQRDRSDKEDRRGRRKTIPEEETGNPHTDHQPTPRGRVLDLFSGKVSRRHSAPKVTRL